MSLAFEELDFQATPLGDISLRRRAEPRLGGKQLYEVKLDDEFLMSSLFTEAEEQLATLALAHFQDGALLNKSEGLDVVVGGLGLGHTAAAALSNQQVISVQVVEVMAPIISWHQRGLVPLGEQLTADKRCNLVLDDFFALAAWQEGGFYREEPNKLAHALLLDIDHSPNHWLNSENQHFYTPERLQTMAQKLHSDGVFGLWSNDPPDADFLTLLHSVFARVESHIISFDNPFREQSSTNTIYLAYVA